MFAYYICEKGGNAMQIECIIANWLLEKLKNQNLISESVSDSAKKKFLQNLSVSAESSEMESKAA